jgi:hypothetical protein
MKSEPAKTTAQTIDTGEPPEGDQKDLPSKAVYGTWASPKNPTFSVRMRRATVTKFGAPVDPWGNKMEFRAAGTFGGGGNAAALKEARAAAKKAEEERLANMTEEQKLAYAAQKREERAAAKTAKKQHERDAMLAALKADILSGKIKLEDLK